MYDQDMAEGLRIHGHPNHPRHPRRRSLWGGSGLLASGSSIRGVYKEDQYQPNSFMNVDDACIS